MDNNCFLYILHHSVYDSIRTACIVLYADFFRLKYNLSDMRPVSAFVAAKAL